MLTAASASLNYAAAFPASFFAPASASLNFAASAALNSAAAFAASFFAASFFQFVFGEGFH
jgi:hypothetical protein